MTTIVDKSRSPGKVRTTTTLDDRPDFSKWGANELAQFCNNAYDKLVAQQDTIQQLRLDLKSTLAKLDKDDWK